MTRQSDHYTPSVEDRYAIEDLVELHSKTPEINAAVDRICAQSSYKVWSEEASAGFTALTIRAQRIEVERDALRAENAKLRETIALTTAINIIAIQRKCVNDKCTDPAVCDANDRCCA